MRDVRVACLPNHCECHERIRNRNKVARQHIDRNTCELIGLSLAYFGLLCGLYGVSYWLPQIVKGVVIDNGLDKATGVSINALTGCLLVVPFVLATVAMIWWTRTSHMSAFGMSLVQQSSAAWR